MVCEVLTKASEEEREANGTRCSRSPVGAAVLLLKWINTVAVAECPVGTHPGLGRVGEGAVLHGTPDV